jgi:Mg-chelatase subunit ChlI
MGLLALLSRESDVAERHEVLCRHQQRDMRQWHEMSALEAGIIAEARQLLPQVTITLEQQQQLVDLHGASRCRRAAGRFICGGWPCAAAALDLRMMVNHDDLDLAARLVILPRATRDIVDAAPPPHHPIKHHLHLHNNNRRHHRQMPPINRLRSRRHRMPKMKVKMVIVRLQCQQSEELAIPEDEDVDGVDDQSCR